MSDPAVDRPGLVTPAEDAAWSSLRQQVTIPLRPIGSPTAIGFVRPGWAAELEDAVGRRPVLPLGRRGTAKVAVQGSLLEQVRHVATEPGVRVKLWASGRGGQRGDAMIDRVAEIWGSRTPYSAGSVWPVRVDQYLADGVPEAAVS